jgi:hypothetical protein
MNVARGATVMAVAVAWMRTQPTGAQFDYRQLARQAGVTEGAMYMALERERQRKHGGRIERVRNPRRKNGVLFRLSWQVKEAA